jgi:hypothetical protein
MLWCFLQLTQLHHHHQGHHHQQQQQQQQQWVACRLTWRASASQRLCQGVVLVMQTQLWLLRQG